VTEDPEVVPRLMVALSDELMDLHSAASFAEKLVETKVQKMVVSSVV
jgi:hypothetical protein